MIYGKKMFKGAITALITPFTEGMVDEKAFQNIVDWQIKAGIHGLVPCGTTGEAPTLTHEEHNRVIEICVETTAGRVPVIAGTGSNSTDEAIILTRHAKQAGADAALITVPYYNKPSQAGLYQHFKAIATAVNIPIILYNIPGRSVIDMSDDTTAELAKIANIVGIKDATGDISRVSSLKNKVDDDFCLLSGEDDTAVAFDVQGGIGCISVSSNVAPQLVAKVQDYCLDGKFEEAGKLHNKLIALHQAMFCEPSPAPAKFAVSLLNLCKMDVRLPLLNLSTEAQKKVKKALQDLELI